MSSITASIRVDSNNNDDEETKDITSDKYSCLYKWATSSNRLTKTSRALSCTEARVQSSSNNGRFKHLCTRFKRRFTITKDYRSHSEDLNKGLSVRFSNYKSFSSPTDDSLNEFVWPDFEKIYDSIPSCLAKALPGLDDISLEDKVNDDGKDTIDTSDYITDEINEQFDLFEHCKRGKDFRRNALCHKLDKKQYHGQLDTFIQQLMIEKLMRTWT